MPIQPSVRPIGADPVPTEKTFSYDFICTNMTRAQCYALKECLEANGITYKVKKI